MKEQRKYVRSNPISGGTFWRQITFYPTSYSDHNAAIADIANLRVVLFLHGAGEQNWPVQATEDLALDKLYATDLPNGLRYTGVNINKEGFIVIAPQLDGQYTQFTYTSISRIIDMLNNEYSGAKSYDVTGLSRGGQGCYNIVAANPNFFRSMGCLSGNDWQAEDESGLNPISPIPNSSITDIRHWHGENDTSYNSYVGGQQTIERLVSQNYQNEATFVTYVGRGHDIWPDVYVIDDFYWQWLDSKDISLLKCKKSLLM